MPNIDDYWFRYKSACEIEGQKLEYISKQALTELIAEIISSPVEPEVKPAIAGLKLAETFNILRQLFIAYEWFDNSPSADSRGCKEIAKEIIDEILRQLSV